MIFNLKLIKRGFLKLKVFFFGTKWKMEFKNIKLDKKC